MRMMKTIDELRQEAASKYPVYVGQKKNPATGKPDCPLTIRFALLAREAYIKKLKEYENKSCNRVHP
jgi:hypothetical protein